MGLKMVDITGQRFGTLTVIERDDNYMKEHNLKSSRVYWKCKCDCGTIKTIAGTSLRNGSVKSCGKGLCYPTAKNLIGKQFGELIVIELVSQAKDRHLRWKCKCSCGSETIVNGNDLLDGRRKSCGCIQSYGEYRIAEILTENNIPFQKQKTFSDCLSENYVPLRFDFFINNEFLLEFDGQQHYKATGTLFNNEKVQEIQKRDTIKNEYCRMHHIMLKRIPYTIMKTITLEDIMGDKYIYV